MRSTHDKCATREDVQKLVSVGKSSRMAVKYTKSDFLAPNQVSEKFGISIEKARDLMKKLKNHNASFVLNGHMSKIIVDFHKDSLYLHPMAVEAFQQHLDKQKA